MVKLRMQRRGAKKKAFYRIVAIDERSPRDGRFLEQLGHYDPKQDPPAISLNLDRVDHWLSTGAQTSPTVRRIVNRVRAESVSAP